MNNRKNILKRVFFCTLTSLMIVFIFANSALPADASSQSSMTVTDMINNVLSFFRMNISLSENFVRKLAHFVEYFTLGVLLLFTFRSFDVRKTRGVFTVELVGFSVAFVDEIIQLFSNGRSGQISDVLLDFTGVTVALFVFTALINLITKKVRKIK